MPATVISSRSTFLVKRFYPWFCVAVAVLVLAAAIVSGNAGKGYAPMSAPLIMSVAAYLVLRMLVWNLADEVVDMGDHLIVRRGRREAQVAMDDIAEVVEWVYVNPRRITLKLRKPCAFGNQIAFSPASAFTPFEGSPIAADLLRRSKHAAANLDE